MKQKQNAGFSLVEVLVAIVLLGALLVPTCSGLVLSARLNAKTDALMQAQLAVSSAVETLMAEGITKELADFPRVDANGTVRSSDRFPDLRFELKPSDDGTYYHVTVSTADASVVVETCIRAEETSDPTEAGEGTT